jgi:hypothetical protein
MEIKFKEAGIALLLTATTACTTASELSDTSRNDPSTTAEVTVPLETSPKSTDSDTKNVFNDDILETGTQWIDIDPNSNNSGSDRCVINMGSVIKNDVVVGNLGSSEGTICDEGTELGGQISEDTLNQNLLLMIDWETFSMNSYTELIDGENTGFLQTVVPHTWVNQIGNASIDEQDSGIAIDLFDSKNASGDIYGPSSCSVEGIETVVRVGSAVLGSTEYGIGILVDIEASGAQCGDGAIVLLNDDLAEELLQDIESDPQKQNTLGA